MNPDIYSPEYQRASYARVQIAERQEARRSALHDAAVRRRRKAKRGGKR